MLDESYAVLGHNTKKEISVTEFEEGGTAATRLKSLIERVERLEEERKTLGEDIKDIYTEAKSAGFDPKPMKQLVRIRKQDPDKLQNEELILETYKRALGM